MDTYGSDHLHNVVLAGHGRSGKTTLAEAMLLASGAISRAGRVEDGNTVSDYDEQEHAHGYSIALSPLAIEWREHRINLLDTPGYPDFEGELVSGVAGAEAALIVVDAVSGVQGGTDAAWEHAAQAGVTSRLFVVTHLDRENTDFTGTVAGLRDRYGAGVVALGLPLSDHTGTIDLLSGSVEQDGQQHDPPIELAEAIAAARDQLIEVVAESSDDLLERYLDGQPIDQQSLTDALRAAVCSGAAYPVLPALALNGVGISALLDALVELVPTPIDRTGSGESRGVLPPDPAGPLVARVLKTVADPFVGHLSIVKVLSGTLSAGSQPRNPRAGADERVTHLFLLRGKEQIEVPQLVVGDIGAIPKLTHTATGDLLTGDTNGAVDLPPLPFPVPTYRSAVHPRSKEDVDKLSTALSRLREQDPTLGIERDTDTAELILLTLGEAQASITAARLQQSYGVAVDLDVPRVPYRETIVGTAEQEYRHKKQTGGHGQFGHVIIKVEPLEPGSGFEFTEQVIGGAVPRQFIPAVESGVTEALADGPLSGSRIVDLKVTLLGGSAHSVDSSEMSFKTAAAHALKEAVREARPGLLEPVMRLRLHVPSDRLGDVMGDITSRRGNVQSVDPQGDVSVVEAQAPLAEVQRYATDLRALSGGRGSFEIAFDHYAPVPAHVQEKVLAERQTIS